MEPKIAARIHKTNCLKWSRCINDCVSVSADFKACTEFQWKSSSQQDIAETEPRQWEIEWQGEDALCGMHRTEYVWEKQKINEKLQTGDTRRNINDYRYFLTLQS